MPQAAGHYKCPACGASLTFGSKSQELECASCGNSFPLDTIEQLESVQVENTTDDQLQWQYAGGGAYSEEEAAHLRSYRCQACGAEIITDETVAATECVYCGNPSVMPQVFSGVYRPDGVIPFQKSKQQAQEALRNHCKGKKLLPKGFMDENRIEKIAGVYVPFWLFQADAEADCTYKCTKVSTHRKGNYEITQTSHFLVRRGGHLGFNQVPVDGSSKMDDTLMESIEPFDSEKADAFNTAYFSGYQAQRYDVDADACQPRANERIRASVAATMRATVMGYSSVVPMNTQIQLEHGKVRQVLMPVWMLNTRWQDKTYTFAMNAQTGRFVGDLPVDRGAFWKWLLGLTVGIGAVGTAAAYFLFNMGVL
jgi:DNA-directed RNA polymerase subunit RPC12/RpoP